MNNYRKPNKPYNNSKHYYKPKRNKFVMPTTLVEAVDTQALLEKEIEAINIQLSQPDNNPDWVERAERAKSYKTQQLKDVISFLNGTPSVEPPKAAPKNRQQLLDLLPSMLNLLTILKEDGTFEANELELVEEFEQAAKQAL